MYQDDNVSAIVEQKSKHKHRRRGTFHYILQKKNNNNIEIFTTYCANKNTFFLGSIFGTRKVNGVETTICCKKKMWVESTKIWVETTQKCRTDWV